MKRELRVWTLVIVGGLLALLMLSAAACEDGGPNATGDPTVTLIAPTGTTTPTPPNAPPPTDPPTLMPADTPTPGPTLPAGICDRTEQVRDAILERIDGVDDCNAVTAAHLSTIDGEMVLTGVDIGELQPGDFVGLTALDALDIRGSGLTSLEAGVFDGLSSLTALDLRGNWYNAYPDWLGSAHWNRLASLEKGVFAELTSLRELHLGGGNRLTALEVGLFDDLRSLEKLDLEGNLLASLEAGLFDSLDSLEYLDISGNPLTSLEAGVFDDLASLRELKLSYAGEAPPPNGLFDKLASMRELTMGTGVASLESGALIGVPITRLSVSLYEATLPGESSRGLTTLSRGLFHGLTSVKALDFSGHFLFSPNPLTTLEAGVFEGLDALEELDLSRNRLATLDVGAFDGLSSLKTLDLSDNKLASLNVGVFRGLPSLTSLDLSINELTSLKAGIFGNLTSLDMLSLHSNPLTTIDNSVFAHPVNLERLELPPSTEVPESTSSEEWVCSPSPHFLICSVRTEAQMGTLTSVSPASVQAFVETACSQVEGQGSFDVLSIGTAPGNNWTYDIRVSGDDYHMMVSRENDTPIEVIGVDGATYGREGDGAWETFSDVQLGDLHPISGASALCPELGPLTYVGEETLNDIAVTHLSTPATPSPCVSSAHLGQLMGN